MRHRILHRNKFLTILITVAMALACCNRTTVYHQYKHISPEGWNRTDTLYFHISTAKERVLLHEELELRTTCHYPFTNLSLIVEQIIYPSHTDTTFYSSQNVRRVDTLNCCLIDKNGLTTGKGINYIQNHFQLADIGINKGDSIDIIVHHNMRKEVLHGIADIGIRITSN